jgi:glycine betaine catabolism B
MYARLERVEDTARNIKTFWFRPEAPVGFVAGQFTELFLPHDNPDDRGQKRWFTISSSPTDAPLFSITTKFAEGRSSTFKQTMQSLEPGIRLQLAEPMGDFVLPKDKRIPLLFVVGNIGITPVHSMVKYLFDKGEERSITLLYNVPTIDDIAFRALFDNYAMQFYPVLTRPSPDWTGATGRVSVDRILQAAGSDKLIYLSGPEPMVEQLNDSLKAAGVPSRRLITDFFHGYRAV